MNADELCELLGHVKRVLELADAATDGPWEAVHGGDKDHFTRVDAFIPGTEFLQGICHIYEKGDPVYDAVGNTVGFSAPSERNANAVFIADARTSVPLLCAGIVALARDRLGDMEVESCSTSFYGSNSPEERNSFLNEISRLKAALDALEAEDETI